MADTNLLIIFATGLFTGGLTCLAVQGGLLTATIAQREEQRLKDKATGKGYALPIIFFLISKLAAYTALGLLLGWFGSFFTFSFTVKIVMQVAVAVFMLGTAMALLEVHPIFRYFIIQPPKFLTRLLRNRSKSKDVFAPAVLGAFTVFIPCGTTQAMMALAIASANPLIGAMIMFAFILGTSPVFFILGYLASRLSGAWHKSFLRFAAIAIILLSLYNVNAALALSGRGWDISSLYASIFSSASEEVITGQDLTIYIGASGYSPRRFAVRSGQPVKIHLINQTGYGCAQAFTIPRMGIQKVVPPGTENTVEFTAPSEPGKLIFSCSMGMFTGEIKVL